MFIATTTLDARPSSVGAVCIHVHSAIAGSLRGPTPPFMPLLRSLADRAACVAINMALLSFSHPRSYPSSGDWLAIISAEAGGTEAGAAVWARVYGI